MWVPFLDFTYFTFHQTTNTLFCGVNCDVFLDQVAWIWYDSVSKTKGPLPVSGVVLGTALTRCVHR